MIAADEDAFLCDMAEHYGVLDWRGLPVPTLAALAAGLREDSRIRMRLSGNALSRRELLLAAAVDRLSLLVWQGSRDGAAGVNRPESILRLLTGQTGKAGGVQGFDTAAEFEAEWQRRTGVHHG